MEKMKQEKNDQSQEKTDQMGTESIDDKKENLKMYFCTIGSSSTNGTIIKKSISKESIYKIENYSKDKKETKSDGDDEDEDDSSSSEDEDEKDGNLYKMYRAGPAPRQNSSRNDRKEPYPKQGQTKAVGNEIFEPVSGTSGNLMLALSPGNSVALQAIVDGKKQKLSQHEICQQLTQLTHLPNVCEVFLKINCEGCDAYTYAAAVNMKEVVVKFQEIFFTYFRPEDALALLQRVDTDGNTLIHEVAHIAGDYAVETLEELFKIRYENKALYDVYGVNKNGEHPIHYSMLKQEAKFPTKVIRLFHKLDPEILSKKDSNGKNILHIFIDTSNVRFNQCSNEQNAVEDATTCLQFLLSFKIIRNICVLDRDNKQRIPLEHLKMVENMMASVWNSIYQLLDETTKQMEHSKKFTDIAGTTSSGSDGNVTPQPTVSQPQTYPQPTRPPFSDQTYQPGGQTYQPGASGQTYQQGASNQTYQPPVGQSHPNQQAPPPYQAVQPHSNDKPPAGQASPLPSSLTTAYQPPASQFQQPPGGHQPTSTQQVTSQSYQQVYSRHILPQTGPTSLRAAHAGPTVPSLARPPVPSFANLHLQGNQSVAYPSPGASSAISSQNQIVGRTVISQQQNSWGQGPVPRHPGAQYQPQGHYPSASHPQQGVQRFPLSNPQQFQPPTQTPLPNHQQFQPPSQTQPSNNQQFQPPSQTQPFGDFDGTDISRITSNGSDGTEANNNIEFPLPPTGYCSLGSPIQPLPSLFPDLPFSQSSTFPSIAQEATSRTPMFPMSTSSPSYDPSSFKLVSPITPYITPFPEVLPPQSPTIYSSTLGSTGATIPDPMSLTPLTIPLPTVTLPEIFSTNSTTLVSTFPSSILPSSTIGSTFPSSILPSSTIGSSSDNVTYLRPLENSSTPRSTLIPNTMVPVVSFSPSGAVPSFSSSTMASFSNASLYYTCPNQFATNGIQECSASFKNEKDAKHHMIQVHGSSAELAILVDASCLSADMLENISTYPTTLTQRNIIRKQ